MPRMSRINRLNVVLALSCAALFTAASVAPAQEPLTILGVTDRGDYADSVTLSVRTSSGYVYSVKLDGDPIPVDVNVVVNKVDYHQLSVARTNLATLAGTNLVIGFVVRGSVFITTERDRKSVV